MVNDAAAMETLDQAARALNDIDARTAVICAIRYALREAGGDERLDGLLSRLAPRTSVLTHLRKQGRVDERMSDAFTLVRTLYTVLSTRVFTLMVPAAEAIAGVGPGALAQAAFLIARECLDPVYQDAWPRELSDGKLTMFTATAPPDVATAAVRKLMTIEILATVNGGGRLRTDARWALSNWGNASERQRGNVFDWVYGGRPPAPRDVATGVIGVMEYAIAGETNSEDAWTAAYQATAAAVNRALPKHPPLPSDAVTRAAFG